MNPKRRKLDTSISPAIPPTETSDVLSSSSLDDPFLATFNSVAADPKTILKSLSTFKEKLATRKDVLSFIEKSRTVFRSLVGLMQRSASEVLVARGNALYRERVLREVVSLLANLCHFSLAACVELNSSNASGLTQLFLRLLESGEQTENTTKASVLRLLGNLCTWKQSFNLTSNANLLDRIASTIIHQEPALADKALRIVRYLSKRGCNSKALILSNSCYYIGTKLSACPEVTKDREDILHILLNLMRFCPRDVGRQLASSNCVSLLFNQLLQEDLSDQWKKFVLKLTHHSFEIRESFGKTAIESVLARTSLSNTCCEFLCSFAQDAWSRVILRESGALARILDVLDSDQQGADMLQSQAKIIASLKHFIYDTQTMVYLCQRDTFIQVVLNHIRLFLAGNTVKCTVQDSRMGQTAEDDQEKYEQEEQKGPENQAEKHDKTVSQEGEQENQEKLHKNFLVKWQEGGVSPNQHYHNLWSPSMSPNALPHSPASSPGMTEDSRASSSGSFLDDFGFLDEFSSAFSPTDTVQPKQDNEEDNAAYSDDGGDSEDHKYDNQEKAIQPISEAPTKVEFPLHSPPIEFSPHQQKTVAKDCLQIITKLTHQEENYTFLVKQDLLCTLLDVISDAPNLDAQLARSIKRLARSKNTLQTLLEMNFHQMVILKLIRRDCILARFSKPCSRCQTRLKFGQEILQEFVGHADSNLGWYLLQQHLRSEDSNTRVNGMMTSLVVIRQPECQNRLFQQFMPVETLLCTLAYTLQHPQGEEVLTAQQTSVCSHILMSLSSLLTHRLLAGLIPNFQQLANPPAHVPTQRNPCKLAGLQAEDPNNLLFHTSHSECIVPKEDLCEASAYFRGMFQNDFAEKTLNRQNFTLDEQEAAHCSETDYHKFLHYLLGCRDSACVQQISGSTVCAMLYLADKYLCSQLLEELLQVNGLAEKCLDGDSLRHFLVPVLSIQSLGDRLNNLCSYTLLRYTNTQQINATLNQFVGHESAIAALVDLLQNFILQFTTTASENRQPQNSLVRLWDYL